jgi:hypothetical protein
MLSSQGVKRNEHHHFIRSCESWCAGIPKGFKEKEDSTLSKSFSQGDFVDDNAAKHDADKAGVRKPLDLYS